MQIEIDNLDWLDLVMFYGAQIAPEYRKSGFVHEQQSREFRRKRRVQRSLRMLRPSTQIEGQLREFAAVVAAWFGSLPEADRRQFDPTLLEAVAKFDVLPAEEVALLANEFLRRSRSTPELIRREDGRLEFGIPDIGLNDMTTGAWFEFVLKNDQPVHQCQHCGVPFRPARSDAQYHNGGCRSAARKQRKDQETN